MTYTPAQLAERYAGTAPQFKAQIEALAEQAGKTALEVFALWREYADAQYDQSALLSEFRECYAEKLCPAPAKPECQTWNPPHSELREASRCRDCGRTAAEHDELAACDPTNIVPAITEALSRLGR